MSFEPGKTYPTLRSNRIPGCPKPWLVGHAADGGLIFQHFTQDGATFQYVHHDASGKATALSREFDIITPPREFWIVTLPKTKLAYAYACEDRDSAIAYSEAHGAEVIPVIEQREGEMDESR